uniref:Uncharacterized protein n=1 Tax=Kalanchoe fedtschenkoi TaxID=63787 RepID=A0A7N0U7W0_KALFE
MIKYARDENETELKLDSLKALFQMIRDSKERAPSHFVRLARSILLLSKGSSLSGGAECNDWAVMVMQMYKIMGTASWI